ncbi:septum site-determining protein MinC [Vibrio parahaemolyticus]|uniref:septum site-determining protein MinC n=1 Tax=Vibrio parahaemolyticus TaxID=670 RepID=UPI0019374C2B|nr:septum site-determining protein MinC [Vibrio parahaemolyticus]EIJ0973507.1 septum site-determining protein MinC [Vibrio parahaemolyticus]EJO4005860.1 septum site-determining protein MinC [Vibrio parahaemolyticus]MBM4991170.1 septum site-determining protein MinC [Vibrio parahaemolyticus]MBM4995078.1 septum site-determining protein MinC [Vibrio parahaemolyticus]MCG6486003.1 septum site-determining protein MinC [Vibrio parahaemolyticus]
MTHSPDLKGSSFTLSVLHLSDNEIANTVEFLQEKVSQAPSFFASAPLVINIAKVKGDIDFPALKQGIADAGFIPVGITGSKDKRVQNLASEAGFAIMSASKSPSQAPAKMAPTKVVRTPVRSGQQIYAKDGDLVVLAHVSAGAEVIADGSIHIHGTLRGRAIAGASGQQEARIICHDLQAELVSIAGDYWLSDQIESEYWQKKVMISKAEESLHLEVLAI